MEARPTLPWFQDGAHAATKVGNVRHARCVDEQHERMEDDPDTLPLLKTGFCSGEK